MAMNIVQEPDRYHEIPRIAVGNRSLDDFLDQAYFETSKRSAPASCGSISSSRQQWRYWCIALSMGVANSSDASEILCLSYILSDADFEEHILHHTPWRGGLLAAAVFLGMLLGGLFIGTLGDFVGRKPMLLLGLGCNAIAGILSALAPNVWVLSLLRCIAGVGIGASVPPLFTLVTEIAPPSVRGLCVTLCASFWMVGSIYVALAALWLLEALGLSWRVFAMACALPSALGYVLISNLVPESPRFLAMEQRHTEALTVANSLAEKMNYHHPLWTLEEVERAFPPSNQTHERDTRFGVVATALYEFCISARKLYTPTLQPITWPLQMVWFSLSFGSYGLLTWINTLFVEVHLKNVYFNALLFAVSNLPGNILTAMLLDRLGRSTMLVGSVLASAFSLLLFAWFAKLLFPVGIVLSACSFQCFTIAAWNTIDCMTSELFPTTVRSTGMGVCAASGRIGAMVAQFINGALVTKPVRLLLVASVTLVLGALTPFLLPNGGDMAAQPVNDRLDDEATVNGGDAMYTPLARPLQEGTGATVESRSKSSYQNSPMDGKSGTPDESQNPSFVEVNNLV